MNFSVTGVVQQLKFCQQRAQKIDLEEHLYFSSMYQMINVLYMLNAFGKTWIK